MKLNLDDHVQKHTQLQLRILTRIDKVKPQRDIQMYSDAHINLLTTELVIYEQEVSDLKAEIQNALKHKKNQ